MVDVDREGVAVRCHDLLVRYAPVEVAGELGGGKVLLHSDAELPGLWIPSPMLDRLRRVDGEWRIQERYVGGSMTHRGFEPRCAWPGPWGRWVHFAVPPRAAWDCVHHFCATVLPFRDPEVVRRWSERHNIGMGPVVPIDQVTDLGRAWNARHADPDWRKWTAREAARIFREVGLTAEFWHVPDSEGSF